MGCGFAGIVFLSVTSTKMLHQFLGNTIFKTLGKISYSFYLLHQLIYPIIGLYVIKIMPSDTSIISPIITTCISTIILFPLAKLSYIIFEKPFLSIGNLTTK